MNFISQYGLFALETFTLVIAVLLLFAGILALKRTPKDELQIRDLDKPYYQLEQNLHKQIFGKKIQF